MTTATAAAGDVPTQAVPPLAALRALAERQDDVVTRRQLRALGVSRHLADTQLGRGRWQRVGRQVLVLHTGPLTQRQKDWAIVLALPCTCPGASPPPTSTRPDCRRRFGWTGL